ncbi:MAG: hypothetical protein AAF696_15830 [Bacteroidota bacterium]
MTRIEKYLLITIFFSCLYPAFGQEDTTRRSAALPITAPAEVLKIEPHALFSSVLLNHQGKDTIYIENLSEKSLNWYCTSSFDWLKASQEEGLLAAGDQIEIHLDMKVEDLPIAIYSDTLRFFDKLSQEEFASVPIEVLLEARPKIHLPKSTFSTTLLANSYKQINFLVENKGNTELDFSLYTDVSVPWLQAVAPTQGILAPGESQELSLIVNGEGIENGSYQGNAWISSNDPNQSRSFVQVDLNLSTEKAALLSEIDRSGICREDSFGIAYQFKGLILGKGNQVVAELSDAMGSFDNAQQIGSLRTQDTSGTISVKIPKELKSGDKYKIRLRGTDPLISSIDVAHFLKLAPELELEFPELDEVCDTEDPIVLTQAKPEGGVYWGSGVRDGKFVPREAKAGLHGLTYLYTNEEGCTQSIKQSIMVKASPKISHRAIDLLCVDSDPIVLQGGNPKGGNYEGTGISSTGILIPEQLEMGINKVKYVAELASCRSEVEVSFRLAKAPEKPVLVQEGNYLKTQEYKEYVWFNKGNTMPNSNANTLFPKTYGEFTVLVKNEAGCSSVSEPFSFEAPDISETIWTSLEIGPNPAKDFIYIEGEVAGSEHPTRIDMKFSDAQGRSMIEASYGNILGKFKREVKWRGLKPGTYRLSLEWEGKSFQKEIIVTELNES